MKPLLKVLGLFAFMAIVIASCKKTSIFDEQGNLDSNSDFNATNLKTWYYKTFVNSSEAAQLDNTIKKYPVWKNGIYYKFSTFEVFEFPLIKNRKEISVPSSLSQADKKRVVESSLTRIRFIKDKTGKISVVEVNYVPEIQYLRNNNYDISKTAMGKENSDFTGRMILIKWNGELITKYIFKDGGAIKRIKNENQSIISRGNNLNSANLGDCPPGTTEWCNFTVTCDVYPDGFFNNCSNFILGDCWCEGAPTDDPTDIDPCEGMSDEQCACQMTGVCGGGDPPVDPDEPVTGTFDFINEYAVKVSGSSGSNEDWSMWYSATLTGNKFIDPAKNVYTSYVGDPTSTSAHSYHNNNPAMGGLYGYAIAFNYCYWIPSGSGTSVFLEDNKKFRSIFGSSVRYPNWHNNQGQIEPYTDSYSNTKFAFASTDLY
jgi:hypothetical protein